jgi:hypothetical protein
MRHSFWAVPILAAAGAIVLSPIAQANCADSISLVEDVQPAMQRLWQKLQQQVDYPWGKMRPYGKLENNTITLTPDFDRLTGQQKQQALSLLRLGTWATELLTPEEQAKIKARYSGWLPAAMSPYEVYASDGRAVSMPYDGCTRFSLLTEKERYLFYSNRPAMDANPVTLRNASNPSWRTVRFAIAAPKEKIVRLAFWHAVGYKRYESGWWIAWVPEQGHFEITIAGEDSQKTLQQFWQVAPRQYRYIVLATDGTLLETHSFK